MHYSCNVESNEVKNFKLFSVSKVRIVYFKQRSHKSTQTQYMYIMPIKDFFKSWFPPFFFDMFDVKIFSRARKIKKSN